MALRRKVAQYKKVHSEPVQVKHPMGAAHRGLRGTAPGFLVKPTGGILGVYASDGLDSDHTSCYVSLVPPN